MKRIPLLFAALIPFAVVAGEGVSTAEFDKESVRSDWSVKKIIGSEVQSRDGREVGEVEEVIFTTEGDVASVLVDLEESLDAQQGEPAAVDDSMGGVAGEDSRLGETTQDTTGSEGYGADQELAEIEFRNATFQPEQSVVQIDMDSREVQQAPRRGDDEEQMTRSEIKASKLIGMEVDLADKESFGEVEDVLISRNDGKPTAFVVDSMDFLNKETYALPAKVEAVNQEENVVSYDDVSEQQVEQMGEYEADEDYEST